jgi:hypothetical protein
MISSCLLALTTASMVLDRLDPAFVIVDLVVLDSVGLYEVDHFVIQVLDLAFQLGVGAVLPHQNVVDGIPDLG